MVGRLQYPLQNPCEFCALVPAQAASDDVCMPDMLGSALYDLNLWPVWVAVAAGHPKYYGFLMSVLDICCNSVVVFLSVNTQVF